MSNVHGTKIPRNFVNPFWVEFANIRVDIIINQEWKLVKETKLSRKGNFGAIKKHVLLTNFAKRSIFYVWQCFEYALLFIAFFFWSNANLRVEKMNIHLSFVLCIGQKKFGDDPLASFLVIISSQGWMNYFFKFLEGNLSISSWQKYAEKIIGEDILTLIQFIWSS